MQSGTRLHVTYKRGGLVGRVSETHKKKVSRLERANNWLYRSQSRSAQSTRTIDQPLSDVITHTHSAIIHVCYCCKYTGA